MGEIELLEIDAFLADCDKQIEQEQRDIRDIEQQCEFFDIECGLVDRHLEIIKPQMNKSISFEEDDNEESKEEEE